MTTPWGRQRPGIVQVTATELNDVLRAWSRRTPMLACRAGVSVATLRAWRYRLKRHGELYVQDWTWDAVRAAAKEEQT